MAFFEGKKVLIIGGTGTIGTSILQRILPDNPKVVRILSRDEHKQFELHERMKSFPNIRYLIGDIRDLSRVERAMEGIDYVFHAAAMKHVPSCEYNPFEAIQTNIIGTQNVIQASLNSGVERTIFTSTDKAISPTNTYGASKLMAERLIASAEYHSGGQSTRFAAVRFGNVMGSRGSVIPLFIEQIKRERCITVTDLNMTRFMMTLNQATSLTIKALQQAKGGEVFVLKMPVLRLRDLANGVIERVSQETGIRADSVDIRTIGLRPGEKMYEELMSEEESVYALELDDMFIVRNPFLGEHARYDEARPSNLSRYSSHDVDPVSMDEVKRLLTESNVNFA